MGCSSCRDSIREEIEGLLREKDEKGRTLEQAMVDHYKVIVKHGVEALERAEGRPVSAHRNPRHAIWSIPGPAPD